MGALAEFGSRGASCHRWRSRWIRPNRDDGRLPDAVVLQVMVHHIEDAQVRMDSSREAGSRVGPSANVTVQASPIIGHGRRSNCSPTRRSGQGFAAWLGLIPTKAPAGRARPRSIHSEGRILSVACWWTDARRCCSRASRGRSLANLLLERKNRGLSLSPWRISGARGLGLISSRTCSSRSSGVACSTTACRSFRPRNSMISRSITQRIEVDLTASTDSDPDRVDGLVRRTHQGTVMSTALKGDTSLQATIFITRKNCFRNRSSTHERPYLRLPNSEISRGSSLRTP